MATTPMPASCSALAASCTRSCSSSSSASASSTASRSTLATSSAPCMRDWTRRHAPALTPTSCTAT
eukprot:9423802-Alexandrium_andersonii.AAC.1